MSPGYICTSEKKKNCQVISDQIAPKNIYMDRNTKGYPHSDLILINVFIFYFKKYVPPKKSKIHNFDTSFDSDINSVVHKYGVINSL